ncbi:MAG: tandem-95 repeat protein [Anaerolineaceae bacterium]|nr:tandem-95 repeat protein [Anaerolineaceae bacterium]
MVHLKRTHKKPHRRFRTILILSVLGLILLLPSLTLAASVTQSNGTDGAVDGNLPGPPLTRTVEFTTDDFSPGASISSVTATVQFAKIDAPDAGSCFSIGHQGGSPFNREIYMFLTSPSGDTAVLIEDSLNNGGSGSAPPYYTYTTNDVYNGTVTVTFDDGAATQVGGPAPVSGTFRPEEPLSAFLGEDPLGTWTLSVGDNLSGAPVCFYDFSLTVNAEQAPVVDDQLFSVPEDSLNETSVGTIAASDADPGDKLSYTVTGGSGQNVFNVNVLTGEITVADETQLTDPGTTTPASFTLNVTVTDSAALSDTAVITINVDNVNDAPVITEVDPVSVTMDEDGSPTPFSLTLNATDQDGDTLSWSIDTQASNGNASASSPGNSSTIGYTPDPDYNGSDSFVVLVDDDNGGTDSITVNVTIDPVNDNPDAVDDTPTVAEDSSNNILDVLANDTDAPDSGETLTITAVSATSNGGTVVDNDTHLTYTPAANYSGTETFTYTIDDGNGGTDTATVTVTVTGVNDPPVITESDPASVTMDEDGSPTAFSLTLNATDLENDTLTWSILTQASNGMASASGTGTSKAIGYTPNANYNGSDSFVVQVDDGNGGTDTITVNVTIDPINDDPEAVDDGYTVDENTSNNVLMVLENDINPDTGETLEITAVDNPTTQNGTAVNNTTFISYTPLAGFVGIDTFTYTIDDGTGRTDTATVTITVQDVNEAPVITEGASINAADMDEDGSPTAFTPLTLNATDGDSDPLTWSIQTQGTIGTASITGTNPGNSMGINYIPNANMNGSDSFVVRVSDGRGGTDDITVNVTINEQNDNPDAVNDSFSVDEQSSDNLLYPLTNDTIWPDSGETLEITAVGPTSNGGTVVNNGTHLTYTPSSTFVGTETFDYTISDGRGGSDTATISVSVDNVNFAPVITEGASTDVTMDEDGSPTPFSLTLHATDADADTLTWSLQSQASHGAATVSGTGSAKAVTYTPTANYFGSDSFIVRVSDGHGGLDSITVNVTINPVNDAPNAVNDSTSTPPETAVIINVLDNDTDPENDTLTVTAVTQGSKGTVTHNGTTVTYTPNANEAGNDTFTYTISDGHGGSDTATVTVQLGMYEVFIPLVLNNFVSAPDLVVTNVSASSTLVEVTIENQGTMATGSGFWVDFYIDPDPVPTQENEVWFDVADEGIVWGVSVSIPAGESLTLRYSTAPGAPNLYYSAVNSSYSGSLPVGTPVYAQVDSAHLNTTYGGVLEIHEILGGVYNNVSAAYTAVAPTAATAQSALSQSGQEQLELPLRPQTN